MRLIPAILAGAVLLTASAALADSRVFIIANQPDGYGVDRCLANSEKCGASAAAAYCQARDFAQATAYRRVDPEEVTGSVPKAAGGACGRGSRRAVGQPATYPSSASDTASPSGRSSAPTARISTKAVITRPVAR